MTTTTTEESIKAGLVEGSSLSRTMKPTAMGSFRNVVKVGRDVVVVTVAVVLLGVVGSIAAENDAEPSEAVQLLMIINPESRSAYDSNSGIVEEKRSPLNHQIIARLMGRQRDDEHRPDSKTYNDEERDGDGETENVPGIAAVVGPRYYVAPNHDELNSNFFSRPFRQLRKSGSIGAVNKDAIQEYGRVIKRGKLSQRSGFLYEPHLFGHDVLFPAAMHPPGLGINRKIGKPENGIKKDPAVATNSATLVLPGKFRIMK